MRFYIWGDGAIWRVPHKVIREAKDRFELLDGGRMLAVTYDWKKGKWPESQLPKGVYAGGEGTLSGSREADVYHYDHLDDALGWWRELLREGRK
jgi:hypothetical protein